MRQKGAVGGSVPNTLVGIEHLGMQVGFIGKLGCDEVARFFHL